MMNIRAQNVIDYPNSNTVFMVWNFKEDANITPVFQRVCALIINLNNSAQVRTVHSRASVVMGISFEAWKKLGLSEPLPKELVDFTPIRGQKHTAVATSGDLHFHIRADNNSYCVDVASDISSMLADVADCVEGVQGFRYWDGRSILGFVDGTENPNGADSDVPPVRLSGYQNS